MTMVLVLHLRYLLHDREQVRWIRFDNHVDKNRNGIIGTCRRVRGETD